MTPTKPWLIQPSPPFSRPPTTSDRCRAAASQRLPVLECGCVDPWVCKCSRSTAETDHVVDGWRDAARLLLDNGVCPLLPASIGRRLWSRGGDDQRLVREIAGRNGFPSDTNPLPDGSGVE